MMHQAILFCLVGVFNTLLDFALFNVFCGPPFRWGRIAANLLSTSCAMSLSFTLNLLWVFSPETGSWHERLPRFLLITCAGLHGVQSLVLLSYDRFTKPRFQSAKISLAPEHPAANRFAFSGDLVQRNCGKALATSATLIWNFFMYRHYVYAD